jgi:hypothetical protein
MGTTNHKKGTKNTKFLEKLATTKVITRRRAFALLALKIKFQTTDYRSIKDRTVSLKIGKSQKHFFLPSILPKNKFCCSL